jgi:hypothetical protein
VKKKTKETGPLKFQQVMQQIMMQMFLVMAGP